MENFLPQERLKGMWLDPRDPQGCDSNKVDEMEATATAKYIKGSPHKARLVIDQIRGRKVDEALAILRFSPKRSSSSIEKVLRSAIANADQKKSELDIDSLFVKEAFVDLGPTKNRRRIRPAPQGRAHFEKRYQSHITVRVSDGQE